MAQRELAVTVYVDGRPYGPGEVPARIAKKITNEKVWAQEQESETPAPADPPPADDEPASVFAGVDREHLDAEVAKRNEGREDDKKIVIAPDVSDDDVVEALDADDAATAADAS